MRVFLPFLFFFPFRFVPCCAMLRRALPRCALLGCAALCCSALGGAVPSVTVGPAPCCFHSGRVLLHPPLLRGAAARQCLTLSNAQQAAVQRPCDALIQQYHAGELELMPGSNAPPCPAPRSKRQCDVLIQQYHAGKLELLPGSNATESLETLISKELNAVREAAAKVGALIFLRFIDGKRLVGLLPRALGARPPLQPRSRRPDAAAAALCHSCLPVGALPGVRTVSRSPAGVHGVAAPPQLPPHHEPVRLQGLAH